MEKSKRHLFKKNNWIVVSPGCSVVCLTYPILIPFPASTGAQGQEPAASYQRVEQGFPAAKTPAFAKKNGNSVNEVSTSRNKKKKKGERIKPNTAIRNCKY